MFPITEHQHPLRIEHWSQSYCALLLVVCTNIISTYTSAFTDEKGP